MEDFLNVTSPEEDEHTLHPSKYADYFATMNPLAARVYEDIRKAEKNVDHFGDLSYDEKCAAVDKYLHIGKQSDTAHTEALLISATSKQQHNEDDPSWTKGFRGRFSSCSEDQIDVCKLATLLKNFALRKLDRKPVRSSANKKMKAPAPKPIPTTNSEENIIGKDLVSSCREVQVTTEEGDEDELKPKQNIDLIAELQAKFSKNRPEVSAKHAGSTTPKPNISKPKAPPPPPPKKGNEEHTKTDSGTVGKLKAVDDEFVVDVSSPCKIVTPKTGFDFLDNW